MPIEIRCPGCDRLLRVADEHQGKLARCPKCSTIYNVPSGNVPSQAESERADAWHMKTPEGQVYGPVPRAKMDRWFSEGRITAECLLRFDDNEEWHTADNFYDGLVAPQAPANPFSNQPTPTATTSHSSPAATSATSAYSNHPLSTPSPTAAASFQLPHRGTLILVLGILGWVIVCPILSIMAWTMGTADLREMRGGRMDPEGMGMTQAGQVLGTISAILWIVVALGAVFVMLSMA